MASKTSGFRRSHNSISLLFGLFFTHYALHHSQWIWKIQSSAKLYFSRHYFRFCLDDVHCLFATQFGFGWVPKEFQTGFQRSGNFIFTFLPVHFQFYIVSIFVRIQFNLFHLSLLKVSRHFDNPKILVFVIVIKMIKLFGLVMS